MDILQFLFAVFSIIFQTDAQVVSLYNINKINNVELFTGIGYRLQNPDDAMQALGWSILKQRYQYMTSIDACSVFFLTESGFGNYALKNAAFIDQTAVVRCEAGGVKNCVLTNDRAEAGQYTEVRYYSYLPRQMEPSPISGTSTNVYSLDDLRSDQPLYLLSCSESTTYPNLQMKFVPVFDWNSKIIEVQTITEPMDNVGAYIKPQKVVWRETILNPTDIRREKTIQTTVQVSETETVSSDFTFEQLDRATYTISQIETDVSISLPGSPAVKNTETFEKPTGQDHTNTTVELDQKVTSRVTTFDITEKLSISKYTCAEAYLLTESETMTVQQVTAQISVNVKGTRFGTGGEIREKVLLPGLVAEIGMRRIRTNAIYLATREYDTIFEIKGNLTVESGIHTTFVVNEIPC